MNPSPQDPSAGELAERPSIKGSGWNGRGFNVIFVNGRPYPPERIVAALRAAAKQPPESTSAPTDAIVAGVAKQVAHNNAGYVTLAASDVHHLLRRLRTSAPSRPAGVGREDAEATLERWTLRLQAICERFDCPAGADRFNFIEDRLSLLQPPQDGGSQGNDAYAEALCKQLDDLLVPESPMHPIGCSTWEETARATFDGIKELLRTTPAAPAERIGGEGATTAGAVREDCGELRTALADMLRLEAERDNGLGPGFTERRKQALDHAWSVYGEGEPV